MRKPTLRKNGKYEITVAPPRVHLDGHLLCSVLAATDSAYDREPMSPAAVLALVREELGRRGREHFDLWYEDQDEEEVADAWRWATSVIEHCFPTMGADVGASPADWPQGRRRKP